jgi:hypothetical protein
MDTRKIEHHFNLGPPLVETVPFISRRAMKSFTQRDAKISRTTSAICSYRQCDPVLPRLLVNCLSSLYPIHEKSLFVNATPTCSTSTSSIFPITFVCTFDRLCGLVVRVPGYRSKGPGFDSRRCQIFWEVVDLEGGPLSLERITEELLERKVAAPV